MFNNPVYKCELLSITSDIRVNNDERMRKNIRNAETTPVLTIMVQQTWNPDYYKEILTDRLIPVYRILTYKNSTVLNGTVEHEVPKSPCFIMNNLTIGNEGEILDSDLVKATADEVKEYAFDHLDKEKFALTLFEIFKRGEKFYNDSKAKGIVSDDKQIKRMLKAIKLSRKI